MVADSAVITWRNLKRITRIPELAAVAILQSITIVLLFAFVFGGAIVLPGYTDPNAYREYLMPGFFAQTIVFASAITAIGVADDAHKGIIDRFRSLPMARSAVLTGRTLSHALATDPLQIDPLLDSLIAIEWVGRLDEAGEGRHVLLGDPDKTLAEPLIAALLLDPSPDVGPFWKQARFDQLKLAELLRE